MQAKRDVVRVQITQQPQVSCRSSQIPSLRTCGLATIYPWTGILARSLLFGFTFEHVWTPFVRLNRKTSIPNSMELAPAEPFPTERWHGPTQGPPAIYFDLQLLVSRSSFLPHHRDQTCAIT